MLIFLDWGCNGAIAGYGPGNHPIDYKVVRERRIEQGVLRIITFDHFDASAPTYSKWPQILIYYKSFCCPYWNE